MVASLERKTNSVDSKNKKKQIEILKKVQDMVKDQEFVDINSVILIENAKVPVLKFRDTTHNIAFDFTVNRDEVQQQTDFVNKKLKQHKNLKTYCMLLKYFLQIRNLNVTYTGGLCSYAQFLMLLHFYELHPVLQQNDSLNNLAVVFLDFFQLYGLSYNYPKCAIDVGNVCYVRNYDTRSSFCILDPVTGNNVASACVLIEDIRTVFAHCYKIMEISMQSKDDCKSLVALWFGKHVI